MLMKDKYSRNMPPCNKFNVNKFLPIKSTFSLAYSSTPYSAKFGNHMKLLLVDYTVFQKRILKHSSSNN